MEIETIVVYLSIMKLNILSSPFWEIKETGNSQILVESNLSKCILYSCIISQTTSKSLAQKENLHTNLTLLLYNLQECIKDPQPKRDVLGKIQL